MRRGRLTFVMPASSGEAFEAFFNHSVRLRWDTLLKVNYVEGGGTHPYAGAISTNIGRGWKTGLAMRTRFLVYDPPRLGLMLAPLASVLFAWETRRRFAAMARYLRRSAA